MTVQRLRRWGTRALPAYFDTQTHARNVGNDGDLVEVKVGALQTGGDPDVAEDWDVRYVQYCHNGNGLLKSVLTSDSTARLIADRADINVPATSCPRGTMITVARSPIGSRTTPAGSSPTTRTT